MVVNSTDEEVQHSQKQHSQQRQEPRKAVEHCHTFDEVDTFGVRVNRLSIFAINTFKPVASRRESSFRRACYIRDHIPGANRRKFKNVQSSHRSTYGNAYAHKSLTFFCNVLYTVQVAKYHSNVMYVI